MDYVELIKDLKAKHPEMAKQPVIAFGGSYGGMLAAYLRMKYPNYFQGAVASSAPVLYFANGTVNYEAFDDRVTEVFNSTFDDKRCGVNMKAGFMAMDAGKNDSTKWDTFNQVFQPCSGMNVSSEANMTQAWETMQSGLEYLAMINYPYATEFLMPVPANPINTSCQMAYTDDKWAADKLGDHTDEELWAKMKVVTDVYFNWNNVSDYCFDYSNPDASGTLAADGWNVLACAQLAMPMDVGSNSMFVPNTFNFTTYSAECISKYGLDPDYDWAWRMFGGQFNVKRDYQHYTNIIFTNGNLDPWSTGGVDCGLPNSQCGQENFISWKLPVYLINGGAHHLELRPSNEADPVDVMYVRSQYKDIVNQWSADYLGRPELKRDIAWAPGLNEYSSTDL